MNPTPRKVWLIHILKFHKVIEDTPGYCKTRAEGDTGKGCLESEKSNLRGCYFYYAFILGHILPVRGFI